MNDRKEDVKEIKQIGFRFRKREPSLLVEWTEQQSNLSDSMRYLVEKLIAEQIAKYGEVRDLCEEIPGKRNLEKMIEDAKQELSTSSSEPAFSSRLNIKTQPVEKIVEKQTHSIKAEERISNIENKEENTVSKENSTLEQELDDQTRKQNINLKDETDTRDTKEEIEREEKHGENDEDIAFWETI